MTPEDVAVVILIGFAMVSWAVSIRYRHWLTAAGTELQEARRARSIAETEMDRAVEETHQISVEKAELQTLLKELAEEYERLKTAITPTHEITKTELQKLLDARCRHCGGTHAVQCPRIRRIRFRADAETPEEIEFWPDDQWPKDRVTFIEDLTVLEDAEA